MVYMIKQKDLLPVLELTLLDENAAAVDLTNATEVRVIILDKANATLVDKTDADASVTYTALTGRVDYAWVSPDTDVTTTFKVEVQVTWTGGKTQRFPTQGYTTGKIVPRIGAD